MPSEELAPSERTALRELLEEMRGLRSDLAKPAQAAVPLVVPIGTDSLPDEARPALQSLGTTMNQMNVGWGPSPMTLRAIGLGTGMGLRLELSVDGYMILWQRELRLSGYRLT